MFKKYLFGLFMVFAFVSSIYAMRPSEDVIKITDLDKHGYDIIDRFYIKTIDDNTIYIESRGYISIHNYSEAICRIAFNMKKWLNGSFSYKNKKIISLIKRKPKYPENNNYIIYDSIVTNKQTFYFILEFFLEKGYISHAVIHELCNIGALPRSLSPIYKLLDNIQIV